MKNYSHIHLQKNPNMRRQPLFFGLSKQWCKEVISQDHCFKKRKHLVFFQWVRRWRQRFYSKCWLAERMEENVCCLTIKCVWWKTVCWFPDFNTLPRKISKFVQNENLLPDHFYNCNKKGLKFKRLPQKILVSPEESAAPGLQFSRTAHKSDSFSMF